MENLDKPISLPISAFDANENFIFKFISKSGARVIKNRLVIRDNETNLEVYNKQVETYRFEQLVPAKTLTNGKIYKFYFITYDVEGNSSLKSNDIIFYCFTTPVLEIINIPNIIKIDSSSFDLDISYYQKEGELLDFIQVIMMDEVNNEIFRSEKIYGTNKFKYNLKGLSDNSTYNIQVIGLTSNDTKIKSKIYKINTEYFSPSFTSLLELENKCNDGYVQIKNNFIIINNESYPKNIQDNPKYFYDNKINLLEKGTYLKWLDGFNINKDFTMKIFLENPNMGNLITLGKENNKIEILLEENIPYLANEKKYQLCLKSYDNMKIPYLIYSNFSNSKKRLLIWIRKINNLFEIRLEDLDKKNIYWNESTGIYYESNTNIYWN